MRPECSAGTQGWADVHRGEYQLLRRSHPGTTCALSSTLAEAIQLLIGDAVGVDQCQVRSWMY